MLWDTGGRGPSAWPFHSPWAPQPLHLLLQAIVLFLQAAHLIGCKGQVSVGQGQRQAGMDRPGGGRQNSGCRCKAGR